MLQEFEKVIPPSFQINSLVDKCHMLLICCYYSCTYIHSDTFMRLATVTWCRCHLCPWTLLRWSHTEHFLCSEHRRNVSHNSSQLQKNSAPEAKMMEEVDLQIVMDPRSLGNNFNIVIFIFSSDKTIWILITFSCFSDFFQLHKLMGFPLMVS